MAGRKRGSRADPICLDSDSGDDDNGRGASSSSNITNARSKRPAPPTFSNSIADRLFAPFRLYATSNDLEADRSTTRGRPPFCSTLREIIGLDGPDAAGLGRMKWIVVANYLIDFDFVIDEIPELLSVDRALVFYGSPMNADGPAQWEGACTTAHGDGKSTCTVDFVRLVPSDPRESKYNPLMTRIEFGVHHTKMFLVGYEDCLRVVIHTSNLRRSDFDNNCQGAYVQDFSLKVVFRTPAVNGDGGKLLSQSQLTSQHCSSEDAFATSSPFEEDLISYLETYRQKTKYIWPLDIVPTAAAKQVPLALTEVLRRYNYDSAYAVLVPSAPGYHRLPNCPYGHLKLRDVIRRHTSTSGEECQGGSIICQFSSVGSLSLRWLHELASSFDLQAARSPLQRLTNGATSSPLLDKLKIVWPTTEEVRTAAAGYSSGGPIPGRKKNVDRPFLAPLYHRWSSATDPLQKRAYPGHIKTFLQLSQDEKAVEWCFLSSHNLSTAALGQIQNNSRMGEMVLFTRHWELGIFISPDTLKNVNLGHEIDERGSLHSKKRSKTSDNETEAQQHVRMIPFTGLNAEYGPRDVILPLPFDTVPLRYRSGDEPWATDRESLVPDAHGRFVG